MYKMDFFFILRVKMFFFSVFRCFLPLISLILCLILLFLLKNEQCHLILGVIILYCKTKLAKIQNISLILSIVII